MHWTAETRLRATIEAPLGAELPVPGLRVVQRPGWYQVITPSSRSASKNEVIRSELDSDAAERVIDEVIASYRPHASAFKWCVGPWTKPTDMGERLLRRGFARWPVRGMACSPEATAFDLPDELSVERVNAASLAAYVEVTMRGWEMPAADRALITEACETQLARAAAELFMVRRGGEIVGSAGTLRKPDGSAYLVGAQVLAEHRGRGAYRALLEARLARLRELGVGLATTHAREQTSAPILERLGFETLFRYDVYQLDFGS